MDPAQAREVKGGSRLYSVRDMAAHTRLKFWFVTVITLVITPRCHVTSKRSGQTSVHSEVGRIMITYHLSVAEVKRSDLCTEPIAAEAKARAKTRKVAGLPVEDESPAVAAIEDDDASSGEMFYRALELDKDMQIATQTLCSLH